MGSAIFQYFSTIPSLILQKFQGEEIDLRVKNPCQKDYKNVAYKSDFASDNQWRPAPSKIGNKVNFDDSGLMIANLYSKTSTESIENKLYEKST